MSQIHDGDFSGKVPARFMSLRKGHQQAQVIQVIEVTYVKGSGTSDDPVHVAADYFSLAGQLLATTNDPGTETAERHFSRGDQSERDFQPAEAK